MEFLLKSAYYGVSGISFLLLCLFFLGNLFSSTTASNSVVEKTILLVSGLTACGFLAWSFSSGHLNGQWAMGICLALLGLVLFGVLMLGGMLLFGNVHWQ